MLQPLRRTPVLHVTGLHEPALPRQVPNLDSLPETDYMTFSKNSVSKAFECTCSQNWYPRNWSTAQGYCQTPGSAAPLGRRGNRRCTGTGSTEDSVLWRPRQCTPPCAARHCTAVLRCSPERNPHLDSKGREAPDDEVDTWTRCNREQPSE